MKRFFGMMPVNEIKKEKRYRDSNNMVVRIQAGPHGWTIIFADSSTKFKDINATKFKDINAATEENFDEAYNVASDILGYLREDISEPHNEKLVEEES